MRVGYLYITNRSYLARSCEIWSRFGVSARDPGVAIERLFRGMRKGRTPSTTLSTAAVCARTSVLGRVYKVVVPGWKQNRQRLES